MIKRFAVLGRPISHSLSPLIHEHFAASLGFKLIYEKIEVDEPSFAKVVKGFFAKGGVGLNITLPYKEKAYELADVCSSRAEKAKAANTLWFKENKLYADNTDGIGLVRSLSSALDLKSLNVLILGAGGASRGIIQPLLDARVAQITIANRSEERLAKMATDFPELSYQSLSQLNGQFDLILNATPGSLNKEQFNLPSSILKDKTFCYDLAYQLTEKTTFVNWAEKYQLKAKDGLGMLIEQAAEAFYIWHNLRPETAGLEDILKKR